MEDDIDIYEDLPSFEARDGEKYKEEIKELSQKCNNFEQENAELKLKVAELLKSNQTLSNNLSSLLKTAKAEIGRKDRMIAELRQQHDNMAFRRGGFKPKTRKPQENYARHNNYAPDVRQETFPAESQTIPRQEFEDEVEEPEQKYEPEKIASTVFGERLRKKILMEQEAERIQKEEAKLAMLESKAVVEQVKVEAITEKETTSEIVKKEPQEVPSGLPEEAVLCNKSSANSLNNGSSQPYEEDDRNLSERRELVNKFLGNRIDQDAAHPESKRRRIDDERYHSDDTRYYNGNFKHENRLNFEGKDNFRASGDVANRLGHRRGSNNREEFARARRGDRSKSTYRSRSRTPDRRHVEKRADRHRTDRYKAYMDKCEKRRHSGANRDKNYSDKFIKDTHDLRQNIEHRIQPKVGGRSEYGDYKNSKLDNNERRGGRVSPAFNKSRSRSRGRTNCDAVDKRRTRLAKSSDRLIDSVASEESSRERKGVKTRSKNSKHEAADRKDFNAETKLEKPSRTRSGNEKANNNKTSSALQLCDSGNETTNKELVSSTQLPTVFLSVPKSNVAPEETKKQRKGSRRKSKDLESIADEDRDRDSDVKSQTATSANSAKEVTNKPLVSPTELSEDSEKEVTNKQLVPPTELSENSEKEVTNKQLVSSTQLSEGSEKEMTNEHLVFTTQQPLSVRLALISKSDETPEEVKKQHKGARRKSKDSEPSIAEVKNRGTESKPQTPTEKSSEEETTNKQAPEEIKKQCKDTGGKSNDLKSTVPEEKDRDTKPKSETRSKTSSEKEETNEKLASCIPGAEDLASKVVSIEVPIVQKHRNGESAESTSATLRNEPNQVESSGKSLSSVFENNTGGPSVSSEQPAASDVGSRSFREEKIENIEEFIQNYQDDENLCCRIAEVDKEELNDANRSCSSILETLSMDLELDTIVKAEDDVLKNSLISEQLLLESLSTPVKKNNPPLPPVAPPNEIQQPPLPPVPPPDDITQPPLPPIPYPEEIKQQSLPPLPPSVEKTQPPLPHSPPDEKQQELPPLPSSDEETKNSPPLSPPERKQQPPLPSPEIRQQPLQPSPDRKLQPPLPSPDCDNQILPLVPPLDTTKQALPTLSSPDKTKSSSSLLQSPDKTKSSSSLLQSPDKTKSSSSLLQSPDKTKSSSSLLQSPDKTKSSSSLLQSPDDKNKLSPSLLPSDETKEIPPSLSATDEKTDLPLSSPGLEDKTKPLSSSGQEDKTKPLSSPGLEDKSKPPSSPGQEDKTKPLSPPGLEDTTKPLLSKLPASSGKDALSLAALPAANKKVDVPVSQVTALSEKNEKLASEASAPNEKNEKLSSEAPASKEKNDKLSSEAPAPKEKNEKLSTEAPAPKEKNDKLSSEAPAPKKKNDKLSSEAPASKEKNDKPSSEAPAPKEKNDKLSSEVPAPKKKNDKLSSEAPASKENNNKPSSEAPAPKEKDEKLLSEAPASKEKNDKLSSEVPAPKEKNNEPASEAPAPTDENETSQTNEISASKSQSEKSRTEKITPKPISRRHKIPCIPIASRYSRKRRDMVLTDSEAARCIVKSDSSSDTETNNNAKAETKYKHIFTKEPKVILKHIESSKFDNTKPEKLLDNPDSMIGKPEEGMKVSKSSAPENEGKIESEIPSDVPKSLESEKIDSTSEIVAATLSADAVTNLQTEAEKNAEESHPEVEPEEQASSKIRKRSALKTIVPSDSGGDGLGASASRKRTLPKEKENQSKQAEKKCKIMVVARRRRPMHLEDSSTATTLISSAQDAKCDDSPKNSAKNNSMSNEKPEIAQSIAGSIGKGRKRRSADK